MISIKMTQKFPLLSEGVKHSTRWL